MTGSFRGVHFSTSHESPFGRPFSVGHRDLSSAEILWGRVCLARGAWEAAQK
jgi:hypothetical protein